MIKIGIIGYGKIGQIHHRILKTDERVSVCAISDISSEYQREVGIQHLDDYKEMVKNVDAVVIASPHVQHCEQAVYCIKQGKHVFLEKPVSHSFADAEEILSAYKRNESNLILTVNFHHRTSPLFQKLDDLVSNDSLGEIFHYELSSSKWFRGQQYFDQSKWRGTWKEEGGGILINQASHDLDLVFMLFGLPRLIYSTVQKSLANVQVDTDFSAILKYDTGTTGYVRSTNLSLPAEERFVINGTKGSLLYDGKKLVMYSFPEGVQSIQGSTPPLNTPNVVGNQIKLDKWDDMDGWKAMMNGFVDLICGQESSAYVSIDESVGSLQIANAMLLSSSQELPVKLPIDTNVYKKLYRDLCSDVKSISCRGDLE